MIEFLVVLGAIAIASPLTVLCHELGHALPAILLTKERVKIYIGSYGDYNDGLHFRIGLLEIWFKYNPFSWRRGLCVPTAKSVSVNKQIAYTLAGPMSSTLIAIAAYYMAFEFNLHGAIRFTILMFLISAIIDLITNLIPKSTPIILHDGTITYNDGYTLRRLIYYKRFPKEYNKAVDFFNNKEFAMAADLFDNIIEHGCQDEEVYRAALYAHVEIRNYSRAVSIAESFIPLGRMIANDFVTAGLSYSRLGHHNKALEFYDKSLEVEASNKYALNNKGFTLNVLLKYEEAIPFFDKVIEIDKDFAHSYSNRGLSKMKMGLITEGLEDIRYSLQLDNSNPYGYRNLGIHHLDQGQYEEALGFFNKAKELDDLTHRIDELIDEVNSLLKKNRSLNKLD